jgi:hypothetical protein
MLNIQFQIGDKVRLKGTNRIGEVRAYDIKGYKLDGVVIEVIQYQCNFGGYYNDNIIEEKLEPFHSYEFNEKFESQLVDLLIDTYLKHKQYHSLKQISEQKYS